jgi:hypothetical protein
MKKFIEFALIWYSQQMAIPFWMLGHVHLSLNAYKDLHEIIASVGLNILVAIGFIIDFKQQNKKSKNVKPTTTTANANERRC